MKESGQEEGDKLFCPDLDNDLSSISSASRDPHSPAAPDLRPLELLKPSTDDREINGRVFKDGDEQRFCSFPGHTFPCREREREREDLKNPRTTKKQEPVLFNDRLSTRFLLYKSNGFL